MSQLRIHCDGIKLGLMKGLVFVFFLGSCVLAIAANVSQQAELASVKVIKSADLLEFSNAKQERDYNELVYELRCLVCQNQNLADSNAELAQQLRGKVYAMLQKGQNKDEIKRYMTDRYGDFVLYRPPFQLNTLLLWLGPFLLLLLGIIFLIKIVRSNEKEEVKRLDDEALSKVQKILEEKK